MLHVYMAVSVYLCMYVTCVYGSECTYVCMLHVYMAVSVYLCIYVTGVYGNECVLMYVCYMCIWQ